jgi:hypothetical protein
MGVDQTGLAKARPRTSTSVERDGEGSTNWPRRLGARARAGAAFRRLVPELSASLRGGGARAARMSPRMGSADDCYSRRAAAKRQEGGRCYTGTSLLSTMSQSWALRSWCKPGQASQTRQPHTAAAAVHEPRQWVWIRPVWPRRGRARRRLWSVTARDLLTGRGVWEQELVQELLSAGWCQN